MRLLRNLCLGLRLRRIVAILVATVVAESSYSQNEFPLSVGDRWEYWYRYDSIYAWTTTVVGETLLANGYLYTVTQKSRSPASRGYSRKEGSLFYRFYHTKNYEQLLYDFSKTTGDTVSITYHDGDTLLVTVLYDQYRNMFGRVRRQWGFFFRSSQNSVYHIDEITEGIGMTDYQVEPGEAWRLRGAIIDGVRYGTITGTNDDVLEIPQGVRISQNLPNPFNPTTVINYELPTETHVVLKVYDLLGREVATLVDEVQSAGYKSATFEARNLSSGVYLYRIIAGTLTIARRMVLVRSNRYGGGNRTFR